MALCLFLVIQTYHGSIPPQLLLLQQRRVIAKARFLSLRNSKDINTYPGIGKCTTTTESVSCTFTGPKGTPMQAKARFKPVVGFPMETSPPTDQSTNLKQLQSDLAASRELNLYSRILFGKVRLSKGRKYFQQQSLFYSEIKSVLKVKSTLGREIICINTPFKEIL
jgi:hypothetical protein